MQIQMENPKLDMKIKKKYQMPEFSSRKSNTERNLDTPPGANHRGFDDFFDLGSNKFSQQTPPFSAVFPGLSSVSDDKNFFPTSNVVEHLSSHNGEQKLTSNDRIEREVTLLRSPVASSSFAEDLPFDGLRQHLVALNLNVDNHILKNPSSNYKHKPDFCLSGHASMTPNPRTQYQSPIHQPPNQKAGNFGSSNHNGENLGMEFSDLWENRGIEPLTRGPRSSKLTSKLLFNDELEPSTGTTTERNEAQFTQNWGMEASNTKHLQQQPQHQEQNNPSYANLQPMQQVILPNGVHAVVMPVMNMHNQQTPPMLRSMTFDSYNRKNMVSPVHLRSQHQPLQRSRSHPRVGFPSNQPQKGDISAVVPPDTPLSNFTGKIFQLAQEQNGCRYLQQNLDASPETSSTFILHEIRPRLVQLMLDPFGNYLFQKLIEVVDSRQRLEMLQRVEPNLVQASLNLHGTRSVQKFIELAGAKNNSEEMNILISSLAQFVTKMSMDTNGNHVVQRCLQFFPASATQFIYDAAVRDVLVITRHRHGCCVFQRCIDAADGARRQALVEKVVTHAVQLMTDPFGNYVVQYVLEKFPKHEADRLISSVLGRVAHLSMQKFSSNVVETCLLAAPTEIRSAMVSEIASETHIRELLHDQYANYVVQRALIVADDEHGMQLVENVIPHLATLAQFNPTCARRVAAKIVKRFPDLANDTVLKGFLVPQGTVNGHRNRVNEV